MSTPAPLLPPPPSAQDIADAKSGCPFDHGHLSDNGIRLDAALWRRGAPARARRAHEDRLILAKRNLLNALHDIERTMHGD